MTDTDTSGEADAESTETPGYTSPTEEILQNLPFGIFRTLAHKMSNTGGGGGGSFEFSVEEMQELHRQFSDEADALNEMTQANARASRDLKPLARDEASMKHFLAAQDHNGKLRGAIEQQLTFAEGFRDAIGAAIGLKSEDDDVIASGANRITGQMA